VRVKKEPLTGEDAEDTQRAPRRMRLRSSVFAAGFILAAFAAAPVLAEEAASVTAPDDLLNRALSIAAHGDLRDLAFTEQTLGRILKAEPQWIDYQGERVLADLRFEPRDSLVLPKPARFAAYISTGMVPWPRRTRPHTVPEP
jgi:hypothetical protein